VKIFIVFYYSVSNRLPISLS